VKDILAGILKLEIFAGYRTYIAAAGLIGLGVFQFSTGDIAGGIQSFTAGLAALGIREALNGIAGPVSPAA